MIRKVITCMFGLVILVGVGVICQAGPMGTAFTYQGRLSDAGAPSEGEYDFEFKLYDEPNEAGVQQGSTVNVEDQQVSDGLFSVQLDFGSDVFGGDARWLQIGARPGDSADAYTTLSPRQELTLTPYALYAETAGGPADGHSLDAADGTPVDVVYVDNDGKVGIGTTAPIAKTLHVHGDPVGSIKISGMEQNYASISMITNFETLDPGDWGTWKFWKFSAHGDQYTGPYNANEFNVQYSDSVSVRDIMLFQPGGNIGIGTITPMNTLDVEGAIAVGTSYAGSETAPSDGMIVEGRVGIGTHTPEATSKVHIDGGQLYLNYPGSTSNHAVRIKAGGHAVLVSDAGDDGLRVVSTGGHGVYVLGAGDSGIDALGDNGNHLRTDTSSHYGCYAHSALDNDDALGLHVTGIAHITGILHLKPRASFPATVAEGDICVKGSAGSRHVYCYLNGGWRQLD